MISSAASSGSGAGLLADEVEELLGGQHRGVAAHGEGDGVGGAARHDRQLGVGSAQVQLGVVRVVAHLGDDDALERDAELVQRLHEQVVGERARRDDAFEGVVDRRRLRRADVDRHQTVPAGGLAEQHHRGVGRDLDPHSDDLERYHESERTPRAAVRPVQAYKSSCSCTAARSRALRSLAPRELSSSSWATTWPRACGLRWRSSGMTSCS